MAFTEDTDLFFDTTEGFATTHAIDSVSTICIVGEVITSQSVLTGAFVETMDVTLQVSDITIPAKGQAMDVDGERWLVGDINRDAVILTITLERPES